MNYWIFGIGVALALVGAASALYDWGVKRGKQSRD